MQETQVLSLGQKDPLEKEMAAYGSVLAWDISMDRGAWQVTVHGVAESWAQLSTRPVIWIYDRAVCVFVSQSCRILCSPVDCSPPGFSGHGILQARILEWVAIPSPGGLLHPGIEPESPTLQAESLPTESCESERYSVVSDSATPCTIHGIMGLLIQYIAYKYLFLFMAR